MPAPMTAIRCWLHLAAAWIHEVRLFFDIEVLPCQSAGMFPALLARAALVTGRACCFFTPLLCFSSLIWC
jgi:hypothetical protein